MLFFVNNLSFFIQSIAFISVLIIIKYYFDKRRLFILGSRLPGPRPLPIVGNALQWLKKDLNVTGELCALNEKWPLVANWLGHQLQVIVCTPEDAKIFFTHSDLIDKPKDYRFFEPILGKGLLTANGLQWKNSRKVMEPAFNFSSRQNFVDIAQKNANILVQSLRNEEGKQSFCIYPYVVNCTLSIISEAIGLTFDSHQTKEILEDEIAIMEGIYDRMFHIWHHSDFLFKLSEKGKDFFQKTDRIKQHVESLIEKKKTFYRERRSILKDSEDTFEKKEFLERLIENKDWNQGAALRDNLITLIGAGFDSTACAVSFTLIMLGIHKDVQDKLYEELATAFTDDMTEKDLLRLEYLEMVIKETMRLYAIIPGILRKADGDIQMGKHLIPKGADVGLNIFALHRNPKEYENPDAFYPDHFLPENINKRHPYSFVPFASGIRSCIGGKYAIMSARIIVAKIVCNYKIECDLKVEDIKVRGHVTLKTENGEFPLRLIKR